jgi:PAS domain S-box-containing protein
MLENFQTKKDAVSMLFNLKNRAKSNTFVVAFTALGYALLGAAGLTLATASGYASPVFPAAGLALACVLWFERRALPGIWLGAAVVNIFPALLNNALSPTSISLAFLIATGATAQAWAGCRLVNRWQGENWRNLVREADVFRFLVLGGILACVLSASIGISGLYTAGIIDQSELLFTWWKWYVGDVAGVFIFAPLTFCVFNGPDGLWGYRRRQIVIPMLLTIGLLALAFYSVGRWDRQVQNSNIENDGQIIARKISERLIAHREVLSSLRNFIEVTPDIRYKQFEKFTNGSLKDNSDIFALSFNDLITNNKRPAFEQMMSGLSPLGHYQITERDSQRRLVSAAARPEYVAVRYIVPLAQNKPAVGYDIYSEPIRSAAIKQARASKSMSVTAPIQLVQEQKMRVGILELMPVNTATAKDQAASLSGFAVAVVKVDEMIEIATRGIVPAGLTFKLIDSRAPKDQAQLYGYDVRGAGKDLAARSADWKTRLRMGDRDWELLVYVQKSYLRQHMYWLSFIIGALGLLLTALLQVLMLGTTGRNSVIARKNEVIQGLATSLEKKVTERTEQLSEANRLLTAEIFERNRAEVALQNETDRLSLAVRAGGVGIWDYDVEKNHLVWDEQMFVLYGITRDKFDGAYEAWQTGLHPDDRQRADAEIQMALRNEKEFDTQFRVVWPNGTIRHIRALALVQRNTSGKPINMIGTNWDISDLKRAEQELKIAKEKAEMANRAKDDLISNVSHELRTPLASIIGFTSTIFEDKELSEEMRDEFLHIVLSEGRRLSNLVDDILDVSRIESGKIDFHFETHEVGKLVEGFQQIFQNQFDEKGVELVIKTPKEEIFITCDESRINQVLKNLISNALKFTPAGGSVFVNVEKINSTELGIKIRDTGIGIPEDDIIHIFEKFYRANHHGGQFSGTGLGLTITKTIIDHHGGSIRVVSAEGAGSSFCITLPRFRTLMT